MVNYYQRFSNFAQSEDQENELKGHMCISEEEISPFHVTSPVTWKRRKQTRKPISRTLSAFLNTGLGGKVYLGVLDNGVVEGLPLNRDRKNHLMISLKDTISRFKPRVELDRLTVTFYPVYDEDELQLMESEKKFARKKVIPLARYRGESRHMLRTFKYCWCARKIMQDYSAGILPRRYVVEIHVSKWNSNNPKHASVKIGGDVWRHEFHCNESGRYFYRGQGSVRCLSGRLLTDMVTQYEKVYLHEAVATREEKLLIFLQRQALSSSGSDSGCSTDEKENDNPNKDILRHEYPSISRQRHGSSSSGSDSGCVTNWKENNRPVASHHGYPVTSRQRQDSADCK